MMQERDMLNRDNHLTKKKQNRNQSNNCSTTLMPTAPSPDNVYSEPKTSPDALFKPLEDQRSHHTSETETIITSNFDSTIKIAPQQNTVETHHNAIHPRTSNVAEAQTDINLVQKENTNKPVTESSLFYTFQNKSNRAADIPSELTNDRRLAQTVKPVTNFSDQLKNGTTCTPHNTNKIQRKTSHSTDSDSSSAPERIPEEPSILPTSETTTEVISKRTLKEARQLTDGKSYIRLRSDNASGLPYSARLNIDNSNWRLHGEECLLAHGKSFTSYVSIKRIPELDEVTEFGLAKDLLIWGLEIEKIYRDDLREELDETAKTLQDELCNLGDHCATDSNSARYLLEIRKICENCNNSYCSKKLREQNSTEPSVKSSLKRALIEFDDKFSKFQKRNSFLNIRYYKSETYLLKEYLDRIFQQHKKKIVTVCSPLMKTQVINLNVLHCMLLRETDVQLFNDLENVLSDSVLHEIRSNFIQKLTVINSSDYSQSLPVSNNVYLCICKSLMQMAYRVEMELSALEVVEYKQNQWKMAIFDDMKIDTATKRCFVNQLRMLIEFANYFEPGNATVRQKFPYQFKIEILKAVNNVGCEQHLWLYLMDSTMKEILQQISSCEVNYMATLETFTMCMTSKNLPTESHESVRMVTHNTLELVAQIEMSELKCSVMGKEIFRNQMRFINESIHGGKRVLNLYRDLTEVFIHFWERIREFQHELLAKLAGDYCKQTRSEIEQMLLIIASNVLSKKVHVDDMIRFFRSFNGFLLDLIHLPFKWFIRIQNDKLLSILLKNQIIKRVHRKHSDTKHANYQVDNGKIDNFITKFPNSHIPNNYLTEIIMKIFNSIDQIAQIKKWNNNDMLTERDNLDVTIQLINVVRVSLPYLKRQLSYSDFGEFLEDNVKPLESAVTNSRSLQHFTSRVARIVDSLWYLRNHDSIESNEAKRLFYQINDNFDEGYLEALDLYCKHFGETMLVISMLDNYTNVKEIVLRVHVRMKSLNSFEWTLDQKRSILPEILADVCAVWSILVSEDIYSSKKKLKPHAMQILSAMAMLGLDRNITEIQNHVAMIGSGQGRSTVVGIVAAVLALLGFNVVILCRNQYSIDRERRKTYELYRSFVISSQITYKTLDRLAFDHTLRHALKAEQYISSCIGLPNTKQNFNDEFESGKHALLIDELDDYFLRSLHKSSYNQTFSPVVPGLDQVQQMIWKLTKDNSDDVEQRILSFIHNSEDFSILQLRSLIEQQKSYKLFESIPEPSEVAYTNETLFATHFRRMINAAKNVHKRSIDDHLFCEFRLEFNGLITGELNHNAAQLDPSIAYTKIFAYFKLRNENFIQNINGCNNFGYLTFNVASFSYERLLDKHKLILGVSGVPGTSHPCENRGVEQRFKIFHKSIMPSICEQSNVKFDRHQNFQCLADVNAWSRAIFAQIIATISSNRPVIVVFECEAEITRFRKRFQFQLDVLNGLNDSTGIETHEPVLLSKTAVLVTREKLLELDFFSPVSVESYGGMHLIQTFFSLDDRDESLVKERMARKGIAESYELIVCRSHLMTLLQLEDGDEGSLNYEHLDKLRRRRALETVDIRLKKIEKINALHDKSVHFWEGIDI